MVVLYFNPRAPCGARQPTSESRRQTKIFQPTRPLRGATRLQYASNQTKLFQPTRPLRGATTTFAQVALRLQISTHAPLAGRDKVANMLKPEDITFQPTRPLRGATRSVLFDDPEHNDFNPRAPCGARRIALFAFFALKVFQPTRPLRGATKAQEIHAV